MSEHDWSSSAGSSVTKGVAKLFSSSVSYSEALPHGSEASALEELDKGLRAWRDEVAKLHAVASVSAATPSRWATAGGPNFSNSLALTPPAAMPPPTSLAALPGNPSVCSDPPNKYGMPAPGGLKWAAQFPVVIQGRLAACATPEEALELIDEALSGSSLRRLPSSQNGYDNTEDSVRRMADDSTRSGGTTGGAPSAELVVASAEVLRAAQARVADLEDEFKERERRHAEDIAQLRRQHHHEQKRSVRGLLDRLAPPSRPQSPWLMPPSCGADF